MSCLTALLLFLNIHQFEDPKLGWVLGDNNTWAYTWISYSKEKKEHIHYFAFNRLPKDVKKEKFKKTGKCKLFNGKEVDILELHIERKKNE